MSDEIKVDKRPKEVVRTESQEKVDEPKSGNKKVWQFRYKDYREILPFPDISRPRTPSGQVPKMVLKARNWRVELDLSDPEQKKIDEYLEKHKNVTGTYAPLKDVHKSDKIADRAQTLQKLMEMSMPQLMSILSGAELEECGLVAGQATKAQLLMAIIDKKKLDI